MEQKDLYDNIDRLILERCTLCPRECMVNRFEDVSGHCGMNAGFNVAAVCIHKGEEPVISGDDGICNVFFEGCNLHCIYCQNYEISQTSCQSGNWQGEAEGIISKITDILDKGIKAVGFVSPSHMVPQVKAIIARLNYKGYKPITVYNTNSYEKPEVIRSLAGIIDVFLPDYKYVSAKLAREFSDASDYPEVALKAIKEMYYQKGSTLRVNEAGMAAYGLLIRHLVLPGHAEESKMVLRSIAEELSPGVHLSLMSQYYPVLSVKNHPVLGRTLYKAEYESVVETMEELGFRNGWVQDMDSNQSYLPDFSKESPFQK